MSIRPNRSTARAAVSAHGSSGRLQFTRMARRDHHMRTGLGQGCGKGRAEAPARAGDDGDPIAQ
jgi:hypothetical protein